MRTKAYHSVIAFLALLAPAAYAQFPDKFTNLQVLPKDISRQELTQIMRGFSFSLGTRCVGCHAGKDTPSLSEVDFASDEKDTKKTARAMLKMTAAINADYVSKLGKDAPAKVECVTCHRGISKPRTLQAVVREELDKNGLPAAVALYRDLKKKYFGGAQYDFTETSLNLLTESLPKGMTKEAAAFMELNAETATLSGWGLNLLAMAHKANGETEKAIAEFTKIVEKNPNDKWAKGQLDELTNKKN